MTSTPAVQPNATLRLYFALGTTARPTRFWHHLSAPALASHLLQVARRSGIMQAMLYQVVSGYLPGQRLSHATTEIRDMRHPQCLELIDTEMRLREFISTHAEELRKVHMILLGCELPLR